MKTHHTVYAYSLLVYAYSLLLVLILAPVSGMAQDADLDDLFVWSVSLKDAEVAAGGSTNIAIHLDVAPKHITYRERTSFALDAPEGITAGEAAFPEAHAKPDPITSEMVEIDDGQVKFSLPVAIGKAVAPGVHQATVTVRYQGCSDKACFFPTKRQFLLTIKVAEAKSNVEGAAGSIQSGMAKPGASGNAESLGALPENQLETYLSQGYLFAFLGVFVAGFLTSLTPCVYPLIPITITIFGARDSDSKLGGFLLALTYVLGIAAMYAGLGYAAAKTGAVFGQYMSNPWVIGSISAALAAMGASMLGAFELQLPSSFQAKLAGVGGKGYASAFFMGMIGGIIAAPCTGPMLVSILAMVAKQGSPAFGVALLLTYAFGLGALFLAIGTFSGMISKLPKAGGWMEHVKSVFGIILFAFALYYLKDAVALLKAPLQNEWINYIIAAAVLAAGVVIGGIRLSYHTPSVGVRVQKTAGVAMCVFALYLGMGSLTTVQANKDIDWIDQLEEGLASAQEQGKPAMIDFWADWCAVCKEIEAFTFSKKTVSDELRRFVAIKIDLTKENEANDKIKDEYEIAGLPLLVFIDSNGNRLPAKRVVEFISEKDFLSHVEDVK